MTSVVNRMAWSILFALTSFHRSSPGRIGRPAASAEVQPSRRSLFFFSDQTAPEPPFHFPSSNRVSKIS